MLKRQKKLTYAPIGSLFLSLYKKRKIYAYVPTVTSNGIY